jgi:gas vesicle protein
MDDNGRMSSNVSYFLMGLGIGSAAAVLLAPKSGEETRRYIAKKTREGNRYVHEKARELRDRAEEVVEHGKEMIEETTGQIASAIDAGRETYYRQKKTHIG